MVESLRGVFGLLPTPYDKNYEIDSGDLASAADFCCSTHQHGIVWPAMVGEYDLLGEMERIRNLDVILDVVNGRLPVVFGCSGVSIPQVVLLARAAQRANVDAVMAMPPLHSSIDQALETYASILDVYDGPIILQNHPSSVPMTTEQIAHIVDQIPGIQYVKEERPPGPRYISEVVRLLGSQIKGVFGGFGGLTLPDDLRRGAIGCMAACEFGDVLSRVAEYWWASEEGRARALHNELLPLIVRETHPFIRYILKRRGVIASTIERMGGSLQLSSEDEDEVALLASTIAAELRPFPLSAVKGDSVQVTGV